MRYGKIKCIVASAAFVFATFGEVHAEEAHYKLDAANNRVLELSNLSPGGELCQPARLQGYVASLNFDMGAGVTPVSVTIKEATGERTLVNVDTYALDQDSMVVKGWVVLGLQTLLREGRRVSLGVKLCGAAGRFIWLDSVGTVMAPQPAPPPPTTSQPNVAETPQPPATAGATIKVETTTQDGRETTFISIEGELVLGDEKRFADAAIRVSDAIVALSSPGGSLVAGIEIGKAIRLKGFRTVVPEGFQCASACAFVWLGGSPRFMGQGATVGFHAAFSTENGQNTVSSVGNAMVGAYLNQLGLPTSAIAYITEPQPVEIRWLTFDDAAQIGIEVRKFPSG